MKDIWIEKGHSEQDAQQMFETFEKQRLETRKGYKHTKETIDKISATEKGWQPSKKTKQNMSKGAVKRFEDPLQREKTSQARLKVIIERPDLEEQRAENCAKTRAAKEARGEYTGGSSKNFIVAGLNCQGTYEKKYIESLVKQNKELPTKVKSIKTPYGYYTPDFEFKDYYVEIKSLYTFEVCIGQKKIGEVK